MNKLWLAPALAALLFCAVTPSVAAQILDTGRPDSDRDRGGYLLGLHGTSHAVRIELSTADAIERIQLYVNSARAGSFVFGLRSDDDSKPGDLLYSQVHHVVATGGKYEGEFGLNWTLVPGSYWVTAEGVLGDAFEGYVADRAPPASNPWAVREQPYPWYVIPTGVNVSWRINADRIETFVPEPATWMLILAGFGSVGAFCRRKQRLAAS